MGRQIRCRRVRKTDFDGRNTHFRVREVVQPSGLTAAVFVYLKDVVKRCRKARAVICTSFNFLDAANPAQKMPCSAQKLHLTHSNSASNANFIHAPVDAWKWDLRNFRNRRQIAILNGQRIALPFVNLLTVFVCCSD
jgi:hypothetical protein